MPDAEVVQGPWGSKPIVQDSPAPTKSEWFYRDDRGRLFVRPKWGKVQIAPVREAAISPGYPQPNRAPEPTRITNALDVRGMEGPEVDEALGVAEPMVDWWESGRVVPSPEEVRRLAELTTFPVHFFYGPPLPAAENVFICPPRARTRRPPAAPKTVPIRDPETAPEDAAKAIACLRAQLPEEVR